MKFQRSAYIFSQFISLFPVCSVQYNKSVLPVRFTNKNLECGVYHMLHEMS